MNNQIAVFEQKKIRHIEHEGEMYFSVVDVIEALTDSPNPRRYWSDLKKREPQLYEFCVQLKPKLDDGPPYLLYCAKTEGIFQIIMSVPSPKAEQFIRWFAELNHLTN
jgi:DNA-damage-inducible protein D